MNYIKAPFNLLKSEKFILLILGIFISFILWEVGSMIIHDTVNYFNNINIDELFEDCLYRNYGIPKN